MVSAAVRSVRSVAVKPLETASGVAVSRSTEQHSREVCEQRRGEPFRNHERRSREQGSTGQHRCEVYELESVNSVAVNPFETVSGVAMNKSTEQPSSEVCEQRSCELFRNRERRSREQVDWTAQL